MKRVLFTVATLDFVRSSQQVGLYFNLQLCFSALLLLPFLLICSVLCVHESVSNKSFCHSVTVFNYILGVIQQFSSVLCHGHWLIVADLIFQLMYMIPVNTVMLIITYAVASGVY